MCCLEQQGGGFSGCVLWLIKGNVLYPFFVLSKKGYALRKRLADRGKAPCGGEGAPTDTVVPTAARQVIGRDFSSPAR